MGILDGFLSLGADVNKRKGKEGTDDIKEGIASPKLPELKLDMKNDELVKLTKKWEKRWEDSSVKAEMLKQGEENENYWKGKQFSKVELEKTRPLHDNAIFESVETYLPQMTRRNPEPMAELSSKEEQTPENLTYPKQLQKDLAEIADEQKLRLKVKKVGRHWALYLLGVLKHGWDLEKDMPTSKAVRPQKLILDPEASIDEDGYTGEYVGERRKLSASKLITMLEGMDSEEGAVEKVKELVNDDLGTEIGFTEWTTDEYICWTLGDSVLMKMKNPHWNWDTEEPGEPVVDEFGNQTPGETRTVKGVNHFKAPKKPYSFLSVFNLGKKPVDETSLIGQNLSAQDRINKRLKQIDRNADSMNGGLVISKERSGMTESQAKPAAAALRKGGIIIIPTGAVGDAVARMSAPGLPADIYNDLNDTRNRLKDIFGTRGSTPSGIESETTVRGKIINRGLDTDRIGGGVSEYLEQIADETYNWWTQLLYVYDDTYSQLPARPRVNVSVKEGSLLPKDSTTIANQAIELAAAGKMALIDLYKALDKPNPEELAANVWLEINAPELLFADDPRVQQAMQMRQKPPEEPSQSINFKDLPPDGKAQLAAKAGINLHPEALAAHEEMKEGKAMEAKRTEAEFRQMGGGGKE